MSKIVRDSMVGGMKSRWDGVTNLVVVDPRGLTAGQSETLRTELRKADIRMTVIKNTVARHALSDIGIDNIGEMLKEMSALVTGPDPVVMAKILHDFQKEHEKKPAIRGGLLEGEAIDAAQVENLSRLPSREQLIAMLLNVMLAPVTGMARVLNEVPASFARVLKAAGEKNAS